MNEKQMVQGIIKASNVEASQTLGKRVFPKTLLIK